MTFWHVHNEQDLLATGGVISPPVYRYGYAKALAEFKSRWPGESHELAKRHIYFTHLFETLDHARNFQRQRGGVIIQMELDPLLIKWDDFEYRHPMTHAMLTPNMYKVIGP